jgi:hypothetical protein
MPAEGAVAAIAYENPRQKTVESRTDEMPKIRSLIRESRSSQFELPRGESNVAIA